MKFKITTLLFILLPFQVSAEGHVIDAKINSVYCQYNLNMCSVVFNKPIAGKDPCHTIDSNRMQFRVDDPIGKALLSIALTANSTQKNVTIHSTGVCTIYNGLADLGRIEIKN